MDKTFAVVLDGESSHDFSGWTSVLGIIRAASEKEARKKLGYDPAQQEYNRQTPRQLDEVLCQIQEEIQEIVFIRFVECTELNSLEDLIERLKMKK